MNPSKQRWALGLASTASLMIALDLLVVSTALSTIRADLVAPVEALQWTVTGYGLSFAALLLTGAALGDRFGRRRMFSVGLLVFVTASGGCALSGSIELLVAARVVQGAGAALTIPVALALVSAAYPVETRGKAIGILEGVTGLATISGPVIGGAVAGGIAWEWIFWVNVPIGLAAAALARVKLDESYGEDKALDVAGVVLVTGGALGLVWGLVRGNTQGWSSPEVIGALAAGAILLAAFVAWELRVRQPMLPIGFFGRRQVSSAAATSFFLFAALYGFVFFTAQFLQAGLGYSPLEAGLALIPSGATLLFVAPAAGALGDRFGERPLAAAGLVLQAAGFAWMGLIAEPGLAYGSLVAPLIVAGIGTSATIPVVQAALIGAVEEADVGKASGANNMLQELGGAFGVAVLVAVFAAAGGYASSAAVSDGFASAIAVGAALSVIGALAALGLPSKRATAKPEVG